MSTIIEVNVQTGVVIERLMTAEEIAAIPEPQPEPEIVSIDPVEKLKQFLTLNPDVAAILEQK